MSKNLAEKAVLDAVKYFSFFKYAPDVSQIHRYLPVKYSHQSLSMVLRNLVKKKALISNVDQIIAEKAFNNVQYALPPHRNFFKKRLLGQQIAEQKEKKTKILIKFLKFFSQIRLIGFSGSMAMFQAQSRDDIDLFVITEKNRLWTGRMICLVLAQILGRRRRYGQFQAADKFCFNLFFDERDLTVPEAKRNLYTAHEVLQMRPITIRGGVYQDFIRQNKWVYLYCPNAKKQTKINILNMPQPVYLNQKSSFASRVVGDRIEKILKQTQLFFIKRHKTNEHITEKQLWFFPNDFSGKLKKRGFL